MQTHSDISDEYLQEVLDIAEEAEIERIALFVEKDLPEIQNINVGLALTFNADLRIVRMFLS